MYIQNEDSLKWEKKIEKLDKSTYNLLREDIKNVIFYSNTLYGSSYILSKKISDIYASLKYRDDITWSYGASNLQYVTNSQTNSAIYSNPSSETYSKYLSNNGFSLKNLFTPDKLIKQTLQNHIVVDVATTESLNLSVTNVGLKLDNYILQNNSTVLVKNQISFTASATSTDYNIHFDAATSQYYYFDNTNGIYVFNDGVLSINEQIKDDVFVYVKEGSVNKEKTFSLKENSLGYINNNNYEFEEVNLSLIKNKVQYQNILENAYYDMYFDAGISSTSSSYIPQRKLYIGDYGIILLEQEDSVRILKNIYKLNLRSIDYNNGFYFIVGEEGTLLKVNRKTLQIEKIDLNERINFNSIKFFNNYGIIGCDNSTIYYSVDSGKTWIKKTIDNIPYLKVNHVFFLNQFAYLSCSQGQILIIRVTTLNNPSVKISELNPIVTKELNDQEVLKNNTNYIESFTYSTQYFKFREDTNFDIPRTIGDADFTIDFNIRIPDVLATPLVKKYILSLNYNYGLSDFDDEAEFLLYKSGLEVSHINGVIYFNIGDLSSNVNRISTIDSIKDNVFHNVVIIRKANTIKLYLDGILKESKDTDFYGSLSCNGLSTTIRVGGKNNLEKDKTNLSDSISSNMFEGNLSDLRFFDKGLSTKEIEKYKGYYKKTNDIICYYTFENAEDLGIDVYNKKDLVSIYNEDGYEVELVENNYLLILNDDYVVLYDYGNDMSYFLNIKGALNGFVYRVGEKATIYLNDGKTVYNFLLSNVRFNIFNKLNFIDNIPLNVTTDANTYNKIKKIAGDIYLLGKQGYITHSEISLLCDSQPATLNVLPLSDVFLNKIKFGVSNNDCLYVKDNLDEVYYLYNDTSNFILELDYVKENTQIEIDAVDSSDDALIANTAYTVEIDVYNLINGWLEVSLDGIIYQTIKTEGYHKLKLVCGITSKLYLNPVIDPTQSYMDRIYCSIKHIRISKGYVFDYTYTDFGTTSFYGDVICESYTYSVSELTTKKLYFPQFVVPNTYNTLSSYMGLSHSWIQIDTLNIGTSSNLITTTISQYQDIYPKPFRGGSNFKGVTCSMGVCTYTIANQSAYNRFFDNLGYTMSVANSFTYGVVPYSLNGFIENTDVNMDVSSVSYTDSNLFTANVFSPIYMNIDTSKYLNIEARSVEFLQSDLVSIGYLTSGGTISNIDTVPQDKQIVFTGGSPTLLTRIFYLDAFNVISYSNGAAATFDIYCRYNGSSLVSGQSYYVEFYLASFFGSGANGNYNIEFSLGGGATTSYAHEDSDLSIYQSEFLNKKISMVCGTNSVVVGGLTYTKLSIKADGGTPASFYVVNLVLSPKFPNQHIIRWTPDTCELSYTINGSDYTKYAFIQEDNSQFIPNCIDCGSSSCDNELIFSTNSIISSTFSNLYNSKMLFLDYDVASKLSFFDKNLEYRLPSDIVFNINTTYDVIIVSSKEGEYNWLSYNKDALKTFTYLFPKSDSNVVLYNTVFSIINAPFIDSISFVGSQVTSDKSEMPDIFPSFFTTDPVSDGDLSLPTSSYKLFFYKNLLAIHSPIDFSTAIGDVLEMTTDVLDAPEKLIINKIFAGTASKLVYMNHSFTDAMINEMKESVNYISFENLNVYVTKDTLYSKFNRHFIGNGYTITKDVNNAVLSSKFNAHTAYYNLACKVETYIGMTASIYYSSYSDSFLQFGYKPTYNISDYLTNIKDEGGNQVFTTSEEFNAMIKVEKIPTSNVTISDNKLVFVSSLKYVWDGLWENTFVDVVLYNNSDTETGRNNRLFVLRKYETTINSLSYYVVECERKIFTDNSYAKVSVLSRNTLSQISSDLQDLNNIQRISSNKANDTTVTNPYLDKNIFTNLKSRLNINFNTDNYSKILLSNNKVKKYISAIVYTDYKNELAMNVVNTYTNYELYPINITATASNTKSTITFSNKHTLYLNDLFLLNINDYEYFDGYVKVDSVVDDNSIVVDRTPIVVGTVSGVGYKYKFDPYLNYIPSDLYEIGFDKTPKKAIRIGYNQFEELNNEKVQLKDIDYTKYKYNLIDNLDVITLSQNHRWFLEAEVDNATIGQDENGLVWYSGDWLYGRFFGSKWYSGNWYNGEWYSGNMNSYVVEKTALGVKVNTNIQTIGNTVWYNGSFRGGVAESITWLNGNFYQGDIKKSIWYNGKFHNGNMNDTNFLGGQFISGIFNGGVFSSDYTDSYWFDGVFNKGNFKSGTWFNGIFTSIDSTTPSTFGKGSSNTLKAVWRNGTFVNSIFTASDYRFSVWESGKWSNGIFENGTSKNILFNGGTWKNGVSEFIKIYAMNLSGIEQYIVIDGNYSFDIGYELNIVKSDYTKMTLYVRDYVVYDAANNVSIVKVVNTTENLVFGFANNASPSITTYTKIFSENNTNYKLVSLFSRAEWIKGVWNNGIFNGNNFRSGNWVDGIFLDGEFG